MAIVTESIKIGKRLYTRTFSDSGRFIERDGIIFSEALDPTEFGRTYTEGEIMPSEAEEILNILMGGAE